MRRSKEEFAKHRLIRMVSKFIIDDEEGKENFNEIIEICSRLNELIEEIARRSKVEPKVVKECLFLLKDYKRLFVQTQ